MANQTELLNVSNEMKLDNDKQNLCEELSAGELCSSSLDTTEELYSSSATDACGDGCAAIIINVNNKESTSNRGGFYFRNIYLAAPLILILSSYISASAFAQIESK